MIDEKKAARDRHCLALISQGGKGRDGAVRELYQAYRSQFLGYFRRNKVDASLAEDLLQDVFVKVVRQAVSFEGNSAPSSWLWTIARNRLTDHFRSAKSKPEDSIEDFAVPPEPPSAGPQGSHSPVPESPHALEDCVDEALRVFSQSAPERAETLRRASIDGWSTEQLAEFLGRTAGATRQYLMQCRIHFRAFLDPCREFLVDRDAAAGGI